VIEERNKEVTRPSPTTISKQKKGGREMEGEGRVSYLSPRGWNRKVKGEGASFDIELLLPFSSLE